jgi:hypothetical protein
MGGVLDKLRKEEKTMRILIDQRELHARGLRVKVGAG